MSKEKIRILIGLSICLSFSIFCWGQDDCVIHVTYAWTVESGINNKETELGLPTTSFLVGYETKDDERSFYFVGLDSNEVTIISHLSSDFCMDYDDIIRYVFKRDKNYYLLKLRTRSLDNKRKKFKIQEIMIPIDSINFLIDKGKKRIVVQLPTIKIQ